MSKITEIVNDVIAKTNTNTTDIATIETVASSHIGISGVTAYHLLQGNLAVDNTVTTQGFNTYTYTGTGTAWSVPTGIDMDTQWGNTTEEKFGGLVWAKDRANANNHYIVDTVRGNTKYIASSSTGAEVTSSNGISAFTSTGFSLSGNDINYNLATYASWNFQTTHRITGTTNHGKAYTCHYNPFTGFTIVKYEGSGIAGHEIPHHLGRKLGLYTHKNLSAATSWTTQYKDGSYLSLNLTNAEASYTVSTCSDNSVTVNTENVSSNQYILYGWANSYFDEANTLIGNYEIGVYQGTGASGNKVKTRGKPAWVMIKRLNGTANWNVYDNKRSFNLRANLSNAENDASDWSFNADGFTFTGTDIAINASGGQYLYMVAYDTNSNGGGGYYSRATDTSNLNISNAIIPFSNGIDINGSKITTLSKNETISGLTLTAGKNYVYSKNDGTYGVKSIAPNYGKTNPANGGDFYDVLENKWYTSAGVEIPESRNYMNHIVYADNDGSPLYVEELPKVEYKDIIKANEYRGKNACTAWVNFDGTTTPPTIRDSYNVSSVVRTATGVYDVYFATNMDNVNYSCTTSSSSSVYDQSENFGNKSINKVEVKGTNGGGFINLNIDLQIFGGKL